MKDRHSKYYHFGKGIVEAVKIFGVCGGYNSENIYPELGPFYCGLNRNFTFGQFKAYFKAPTSTSKDIEVAINFASRDGMIMEIQNKYDQATLQKIFDCSWLSRYSEENERLIIGYDMMVPLRLASIRIVETGKNYRLFFESAWIFNAILSGTYVDGVEYLAYPVSQENIDVISYLIGYKLGLSPNNENIDEYLLQCFDLYLSNTTQLRIQLHQIYRFKVPFLFNDIHPTREKQMKGVDIQIKGEYLQKTGRVSSISKYYHEYIDGHSGLKFLNVINVSNCQKLFSNLKSLELLVQRRPWFDDKRDVHLSQDFEFDCMSYMWNLMSADDEKMQYTITVEKEKEGSEDTWLSKWKENKSLARKVFSSDSRTDKFIIIGTPTSHRQLSNLNDAFSFRLI